jgi:predicted lipid-binding transport protein (Tim44 family)
LIKLSRPFVALTLGLALAGAVTAPADARRGGSFGSRGSRTYSAPRPTSQSSQYVPPVQRTMTQRPAGSTASGYANPGYGATPQNRSFGSRFGGFGGGLLGGLVAGGLIGHFLGYGAGGGWGGGGGGMLLVLLQLAILAGLAWLVVGFFRRRSAANAAPQVREAYQPSPAYTNSPYASPASNAPPAAAGPWGAAAPAMDGDTTDIALTPADQATFERLLTEVQDAFGREDYGKLRARTTPEIMSYLAEELSENATQGLRNEVTGTRLLDAEVSEAWHEAAGDYATIAMRYESIDLMRNRATGEVSGGSASVPTQTTELWTFFRDAGGEWKLSAIQEA